MCVCVCSLLPASARLDLEHKFLIDVTLKNMGLYDLCILKCGY